MATNAEVIIMNKKALLEEKEQLEEKIGELFSSGADLTTEGNKKISKLSRRIEERDEKLNGLSSTTKELLEDDIEETRNRIHEIHLSGEQEARKEELEELQNSLEELIDMRY